MITHTRKNFKLAYGMNPGDVFDLRTILTPEHKIDCMRNPMAAIIRAEYGTMGTGAGEIYYKLIVRWWIGDDGNMKGVIDYISFFESQAELDLDKMKLTSAKLNQN